MKQYKYDWRGWTNLFEPAYILVDSDPPLSGEANAIKDDLADVEDDVELVLRSSRLVADEAETSLENGSYRRAEKPQPTAEANLSFKMENRGIAFCCIFPVFTMATVIFLFQKPALDALKGAASLVSVLLIYLAISLCIRALPKAYEFVTLWITSMRAGIEIKKIEHRGITLAQLKELAKQVEIRCAQERWMSTNPSRQGETLQPEDVTLYDLVHHYIKPVTASSSNNVSSSYVEKIAVSEKEQIPKWFVSHWWGDSVLDFVSCIEQHAIDRALPEDTAYWVCAYALNQHKASTEVGQDPSQSPFYKALKLCHGMISMLDHELVCFQRIWCSFELALAMKEFGDQPKNNSTLEGRFLHDMYLSGSGMGLTDGIVEADKSMRIVGTHGNRQCKNLIPLSPSFWPGRKARRERLVPLWVCTEALQVQVENSIASQEEDRKRILNYLAGSDTTGSMDIEPPPSHPVYEEVNIMLRCKFAMAAYHKALLSHSTAPIIERFRQSIAMSSILHLEMSFSACENFRVHALHFIQSLPQTLETIALDYSIIKFQNSGEFAARFNRFTNLKSFHLSCSYCTQLVCWDHLWDEIKELTGLRELHLTLFPHMQLTSLQGLANAISNLASLESITISMDDFGEARECLQSHKFLKREVSVMQEHRACGAITQDDMDSYFFALACARDATKASAPNGSIPDSAIKEFCEVLAANKALRYISLGFLGPLGALMKQVETTDDIRHLINGGD